MAVYALLKQPNHDFESALDYGPIDVLFPLGVNIVDADVIGDAAREWFKYFDFEDDYFLPVGNPIVVSLVSLFLMESATQFGAEQIKMLEWDKKSASYTEKTLYLTGE